MSFDDGTSMARADDAPAELNAPGASTPVPAPPVLPPKEQMGTPPDSMVAQEPDLSEEGLKREAEAKSAAEGDKEGVKPEAATTEAAPTDASASADAAPVASADAPAPDASAKAEDVSPGKLATQLRNRERRLVEQQTTFARQRAEHEQAVARERAEIQAQRSQLDAYKAQIEQSSQIVQSLRSDPITLLRQIGWTDEQISERLTNGNKPTLTEGEQRVSRAVEEMDKRWAARFEAQEKALAEERAARQHERQQAIMDRELAKFSADVRAGASKWPLASALSDADEAEFRSRGMAIAESHVRSGVALSNEEVLDKLEEQLAKYETIVTKARPGKSSAAGASQQRPTSPSVSAKSPQAQPGKPQSAPTLTSAGASQRTTDFESRDPLTMTDEELAAWTASEIERAKANGASARR